MDLDTPQSKVSGLSSMVPSTVKSKTTPKQAQEPSLPIEFESEEDESLETTKEDNKIESDEKSEPEEDSKLELVSSQHEKGKGKTQTPIKGKVTRVSKASVSRK